MSPLLKQWKALLMPINTTEAQHVVKTINDWEKLEQSLPSTMQGHPGPTDFVAGFLLGTGIIELPEMDKALRGEVDRIRADAKEQLKGLLATMEEQVEILKKKTE